MSVQESYDFIVSEATKSYGTPMQQTSINGMSSTVYLTDKESSLLVKAIESSILSSDFKKHNDPNMDISKEIANMRDTNPGLPKVSDAKNTAYLHSSGSIINIQQITVNTDGTALPMISITLVDMNNLGKDSAP